MLAHARRLSITTRASVVPASQRLFTSFPVLDTRRRAPVPAPVSIGTFVPLGGLHPHSLRLPTTLSLQVRSYARHSGRNPWEPSGGNRDWLSTVKTGALLAVGAGAVVAAASVGFGFVVFGAAGYGVYSLYQRFFAPYRSNDPIGSVQADLDRIFKSRQSPRSPSHTSQKASGDQDLDALVSGLPFVVRGLVKTLFSFAGTAMKSSMARAGELRRLANDAMQTNASIVAQMGNDVSISTPQNWMEYTVNGAGRVEAVFPVIGNGFAQAQLTAKASVGGNGELTLQELTYRNQRTGEAIDLMRGSGSTPGTRRKRVVEAEFVDLDDRK